MRDDSYLQRESDAAEAKTSAWRGRAATTAGALISLAILAIVVIWSYRLGVRDANDVPVIRAQTEATKIKPDDPGGIEIAHQNREVYNIVDGTSSSTEGAFAPSEETLTAADAPVSPSPAPRPAEVTETTVVPASPAPVEETAQAPVPAAPETVAEAEPATAAEVEAEPAETTEDVSAVAPKAAPVALRRPARAAPKPQQASTLAEPRAAALASRIQIQLGAFNTEEIAASQWAELKNRNGDLLSGRARVVTPVVSGGRRLYRLRAGPFKDVDEASTLCRALKARGEDCIVARAK